MRRAVGGAEKTKNCNIGSFILLGVSYTLASLSHLYFDEYSPVTLPSVSSLHHLTAINLEPHAATENTVAAYGSRTFGHNHNHKHMSRDALMVPNGTIYENTLDNCSCSIQSFFCSCIKYICKSNQKCDQTDLDILN
jgi:hypothetical protein